MLFSVRALAALLLVCQFARADQAKALPDDPDLELAHRYYEEGAGFYDRGQYQAAIASFEKARAVKPAPGLDFNIARSYDRMGNIDPALAAYHRYLDANPNPKDAAEIRTRIAVLEQRASTTEKPIVVAPKKKRTWVYAVAAVAAVAVVGVAVGVGVGLGVKPADPSPQLGAIHW
jgi:tetratricopeptide (TPR) repeat protein